MIVCGPVVMFKKPTVGGDGSSGELERLAFNCDVTLLLPSTPVTVGAVVWKLRFPALLWEMLKCDRVLGRADDCVCPSPSARKKWRNVKIAGRPETLCVLTKKV